MSHTINEVRRDVDHLKTRFDGDGNGIKGIVRRMDSVESKQAETDRIIARIEKMFWAIITAVIISMLVTMLPKIYAPPQSTSTASRTTNSPDAAN